LREGEPVPDVKLSAHCYDEIVEKLLAVPDINMTLRNEHGGQVCVVDRLGVSFLRGEPIQITVVVDGTALGRAAIKEIVDRSRLRKADMTHTYAVLEVSRACYDEIRALLVAAGYEHALSTRDRDYGEVIDMHGIALGAEPPRQEPRQE
jgi:hypothetical protein